MGRQVLSNFSSKAIDSLLVNTRLPPLTGFTKFETQIRMSLGAAGAYVTRGTSMAQLKRSPWIASRLCCVNGGR